MPARLPALVAGDSRVSEKVDNLSEVTRRHARRMVGAVLALSLVAGPAGARCARDEDQAAFDIQALKSELVVLAVGACEQEDKYNEFVVRFRPQLIASDRALTEWFSRNHGRRGAAAQNAFVTDVTNLRSLNAQRLGTDYCARNSAIWGELAALPAADNLAAYAAGKNLVPAEITSCDAPHAAAPARPARRAAR